MIKVLLYFQVSFYAVKITATAAHLSEGKPKMSLSDRFKRLPEEQTLRYEESKTQARDASALLTRLRATREAAERVAIDEINRTKAMQREEVEQNPAIQDLKRRIASAEAAKDAWMRKAEQQQASKDREIQRLKAHEDQLHKRFQESKEVELRQRSEFEKERQARDADEARLKSLQVDLDNCKREEDFQFVQQFNSAQQDCNEAEREFNQFKATQPDPAWLRAELKRVDSQVQKETEDLDAVRSRQLDWQAKRNQAHVDLHKAESLLEESRARERACKEKLDKLLVEGIGVNEAEDVLREAEQVRSQLLQMRSQFEEDMKNQNARITAEESKLQSIRNEIRRLMQAETEQLKCINDAHSAMSQAQSNCSRVENDLKSAEIRLRDAQELSRQAESSRAAKAEEIRQLQAEYDRFARAQHEAGVEAGKARDIINQIDSEIRSGDTLVAEKERKLSELCSMAADLSDKLDRSARYDVLKADYERKRDNLQNIRQNWLNWKSERLQPLFSEMQILESKLRVPFRPAPVSKQTDALWREIESVRDRIRSLENEPAASSPINFEDPESLRNQLNQKEIQIRAQLVSRTNPTSPRFTRQLEREAEAIMRAEAASALEKKQASIEREASALSSIYVEQNPQLTLDDEAKTRLWSLNEEAAETGTIAQTVLDLVHSRNISIREKN